MYRQTQPSAGQLAKLRQRIIGPSEQESTPRYQQRNSINMRIYRDIPVPSWKIVFPNKLLQFRPLDGLRSDLVSIAGLLCTSLPPLALTSSTYPQRKLIVASEPFHDVHPLHTGIQPGCASLHPSYSEPATCCMLACCVRPWRTVVHWHQLHTQCILQTLPAASDPFHVCPLHTGLTLHTPCPLRKLPVACWHCLHVHCTPFIHCHQLHTDKGSCCP